jgi:hypothetical protein
MQGVKFLVRVRLYGEFEEIDLNGVADTALQKFGLAISYSNGVVGESAESVDVMSADVILLHIPSSISRRRSRPLCAA